MFFPPLYPAFEMFGFHLIAVYHLPLKISVNLMQVQPMRTRDIRSGFQDIGTQFVNIAGFTRIVTGSLDTTSQRTGLYFKSCYVVSLPTMK